MPWTKIDINSEQAVSPELEYKGKPLRFNLHILLEKSRTEWTARCLDLGDLGHSHPDKHVAYRLCAEHIGRVIDRMRDKKRRAFFSPCNGWIVSRFAVGEDDNTLDQISGKIKSVSRSIKNVIVRTFIEED